MMLNVAIRRLAGKWAATTIMIGQGAGTVQSNRSGREIKTPEYNLQFDFATRSVEALQRYVGLKIANKVYDGVCTDSPLPLQGAAGSP